MKRQVMRLVILSATIFLPLSFIFAFVSKSFSQPSIVINTTIAHLNTILNSIGNETIIVFTEYSILNASKIILTAYCTNAIREEQI